MDIQIVSLTITEYLTSVRDFSARYQGDASKWYELSIDKITDEDDRDEFAFIKMALWDQLIHEEFYKSPPLRVEKVNTCDTVEPGTNLPGSSLLGGVFWARTNMQSTLNAY